MRSFKALLLVTMVGAAAIAAACGGSDGANGAAGAPGAAGAAGTAGANGPQGPPGANGTSSGGADASTSYVFLTERAQKGMAITPVPVNLGGKTPAEIEAIGIGSYIVNAAASCSDCHTPAPNKFLAGGLVFPLDAAGHFVVTRNLTPDPATGLKDTEDQFIQAFQNGTDILNVGQGLLVHPWQYERWMTKTDIKAIYAYLRAIPPVNNSYASDNKPNVPGLTFPGVYDEGQKQRALPPDVDFTDAAAPDPDNVLRGLAIVPLDITYPTDPQQLTLFGRGSYLVNAVVGCAECHSNPARDPADPTQKLVISQYLTGGRVIPADPSLQPIVRVTRAMSADLIGQTHGFFNEPSVSFQTFLTLMTQGIHAEDPANPRPLSYPMPFQNFRQMTLGDLEAVYTYFKWIATQAPATGPLDKVTLPPSRYCANDNDCLTGIGETCDMTAKECINTPCPNGNDDCATCQTCNASKKCVAPAANDPTCFAGR